MHYYSEFFAKRDQELNLNKLTLFFITLLISSFDTYAKEVSLVLGENNITIYGVSSEELQSLKYQSVDEASVDDVTGQIVKSLHQAGYLAAEGFVISEDEIFLNQGVIIVANVFGLSGKADAATKKLAQKLVGKRPNVEELDEALANINALSGVDATFALEASNNKIMDPRGWTPDNNTSHYTLIVKAAEQAQQFGAISLDSAPTKLFQRNRATISQTFNSVFVGGDHIQGSLTHLWGDREEPQNEGSATYIAPLMDNGLYAELYGSYSVSENDVQPNVTRDFQGTTYTGTIGYPIRRHHDETLTILGGVGYQGEDQEGQPKARTKAGTATLFYNHSDPEGNSITAAITLTSGDADSQSNVREDGDFSHWRFGTGYIHALNFLGDDTELRLEFFGQLTGDTLPGSQKFVLGGAEFLRGYPSGVFSGSQGLAGTIEVGHKYFFNNKFVRGLSVKAFFDVGTVKNRSADATSANRPESETIRSIGIASSADLGDGFSLSGWLGAPLDKGNKGESLDPAVYLKLTKGW